MERGAFQRVSGRRRGSLCSGVTHDSGNTGCTRSLVNQDSCEREGEEGEEWEGGRRRRGRSGEGEEREEWGGGGEGGRSREGEEREEWGGEEREGGVGRESSENSIFAHQKQMHFGK